MKLTSRVEPISAWENGFVVLVLLISTTAFMNLLDDPESQVMDPRQGMWFMQVFWACVYLLTLRLLLLHCRPLLQMLLRQWPLVLLLALALASISWSVEPSITLRKATALAMSALFGAYLGLRYSPREQLRLLAWTCSIIIVLSFVFSLLGIGTPVNSRDSGWFGVFVHRNALGRMMAFSTVLFAICSRVYKEHKLQAWLGILLSLSLLLLSTSKGSIVYVTVLLCILPLVPRLRGRLPKVIGVMVFAGISATAILYLIITHFEEFTAILDRDPNMTGRIPLWIASATMALQRPWLGYGYGAFWEGTEGPSLGVWRLMNWEVPHAHNGLLNLWLDLGLVGVGLFLAGFLLCLYRAFRQLRANTMPEAIWPLMFLVFLFISNLTEGDMVNGNTMSWIVYTAVFISLVPKTGNITVPARVSARRRMPRLVTVKVGVPARMTLGSWLSMQRTQPKAKF
jgi:exopolysaccharide production protein ExoQ